MMTQSGCAVCLRVAPACPNWPPAFSPDFFLTYLVWGLPFFIMAGYLLEVAILQAFLVIPTVAYYLSLWPSRRKAAHRLSMRDSGDGARGTRTPDLLGAIQALSQLSYSPERRLVAPRTVHGSGRQAPPGLEQLSHWGLREGVRR